MNNDRWARLFPRIDCGGWVDGAGLSMKSFVIDAWNHFAEIEVSFDTKNKLWWVEERCIKRKSYLSTLENKSK